MKIYSVLSPFLKKILELGFKENSHTLKLFLANCRLWKNGFGILAVRMRHHTAPQPGRNAPPCRHPPDMTPQPHLHLTFGSLSRLWPRPNLRSNYATVYFLRYEWSQNLLIKKYYVEKKKKLFQNWRCHIHAWMLKDFLVNVDTNLKEVGSLYENNKLVFQHILK